MRLTTLAAAFSCLLPLPAAAQGLSDTARTIIVLDGSGSMWGQIDGRPKLEIAREVLGRVLAELPPERELGLMAYGHRRRGDCTDIELVVPPAPGSAGAIIEAANRMRFQGRTPLTDAVREAARALNFTENPATVVLITDGIETCQADPCALGRELAAAGIDFTAHVVGFDMTAAEGAQVACLAQETGGQYLLAADARGLAAALTATVAAAPGGSVAPPPPPPPEPVAAVADPLPPASLSAPSEVRALERFSVEVTGPLNPGDYLDVVYDGQTRVGDSLFWVLLSEGLPARLTAPVEPGDYAIRYIEARPGVQPRVLATAPLTVAPAEFGLQAADRAVGGTLLRVEWQGPAGPEDWIDIAPAGSDDPNAYLPGWAGALAAGVPAEVVVPTTAGSYALRYVAVGPEGPRVMARRPLAVLPPEASLTAPDRVEAGARFRVGWTGPAHPSHYVTIVPEGAEDAAYLSYFHLGAPGVPGELQAPEAPGRYELRFILYTDGVRMLASRPVEVVAPGTLPAAAPEAPAAAPAPAADKPAAPLPDRSALPAPAGADLAFACPAEAPEPCAHRDPATGFTFRLAPGYGITEPFFYTTAAGVQAARPTLELVRLADAAPVVWVNPRQSTLTCLAADPDLLCLDGTPGFENQMALMLLMASLAGSYDHLDTPVETQGMGEDDFAGIWTLRIWQAGHPRQESPLAVVELEAPDAEGITRGRFRSAPDFEGFAGLSGEVLLGFFDDGRMRLDLIAADGQALVFAATPFGPFDWTGELAPPGVGGPDPVGAALSRQAGPGEDWRGAPWMHGTSELPDPEQAAIVAVLGALGATPLVGMLEAQIDSGAIRADTRVVDALPPLAPVLADTPLAGVTVGALLEMLRVGR